jgi:hypothetical protein
MKNLALTAVLAATSVSAQTQTGAATTRGACSPANTGDKNVFNITCGIGREQGDKMLAILNRIIDNQIDPSAVMSKLDEIQKGVDAIRDQAAPRTITDQDVAAVSKFLSQFPKQTVKLAFLSANEESRRLAERIRSMVLAAGWECEPASPLMPFATGPLPGIEIRAKEDTKAANGFLNAIHRIGLGVVGNLSPNLEPNVITVTVFAKP